MGYVPGSIEVSGQYPLDGKYLIANLIALADLDNTTVSPGLLRFSSNQDILYIKLSTGWTQIPITDKVGLLSALTTAYKENIVGALNEVKASNDLKYPYPTGTSLRLSTLADSASDISGGTQNTSVGYLAGGHISYGNSTFGYRAGASVNGNNNTAIGSQAGGGGFNNVTVGAGAGVGLSTGGSNVLLGSGAGNSVSTTTNNIYIGQNAGHGSTGDGNIAIGTYATAGNLNSTIAIGHNANPGANNACVIGSFYNIGLGGVVIPAAKLHIKGNFKLNDVANSIIYGDNTTQLTSPETSTLSNITTTVGIGAFFTGSTIRTALIGLESRTQILNSVAIQYRGLSGGYVARPSYTNALQSLNDEELAIFNLPELNPSIATNFTCYGSFEGRGNKVVINSILTMSGQCFMRNARISGSGSIIFMPGLSITEFGIYNITNSLNLTIQASHVVRMKDYTSTGTHSITYSGHLIIHAGCDLTGVTFIRVAGGTIDNRTNLPINIVTYSSFINLDMGSNSVVRMTLTGDLTVAVSNLHLGTRKTLILTCDNTNRNLSFPAEWKWMSSIPVRIAGGSVSILNLEMFGINEVFAQYATQQLTV